MLELTVLHQQLLAWRICSQELANQPAGQARQAGCLLYHCNAPLHELRVVSAELLQCICRSLLLSLWARPGRQAARQAALCVDTSAHLGQTHTHTICRQVCSRQPVQREGRQLEWAT